MLGLPGPPRRQRAPAASDLQLRIEPVAQGVAEQVEAEHGERDGDAREDRDPRRALGVFRPAPQHQAPGRDRLLHAEAEKRQRRLEQDRLSDGRRHHHQIGREHIGHHVPHDDAGMAEAGCARGVDVGHLPHRQRARPHHPGAARDERYGDGHDHVERAGAEDRHHGQRQDDQRKGHQHVHDAHQDHIETAAEMRAGDPEDQSHRAADEGRDEADQQSRARAVHDTRIEVAAELVGAQPVGGAGCLERWRGNCWRSGRRPSPRRPGPPWRS